MFRATQVSPLRISGMAMLAFVRAERVHVGWVWPAVGGWVGIFFTTEAQRGA